MKKLIVFCGLLLWLPLAGAAQVFGTVDALAGSATVTGGDGQSSALSVGMKVYEGDTINSAHDGEVQIVTEDGGFIALRPDTVFRIDAYQADGSDDDKTFMSLLKGAARSITGWIGRHDNAAYRLSTPTATIGIRGTDHEVAVVDKGDGDQPGTYDTVNEGSTVLKSGQGEVVATPGKYAFAPRGRAVAPYFLTQRPRFFALRRLRLEGRVLQRRQYLRPLLQQMREDRIRTLRELRGQRPVGTRLEQRPRLLERRNERRELRREGDATGEMGRPLGGRPWARLLRERRENGAAGRGGLQRSEGFEGGRRFERPIRRPND